jgi:hypothetical protein
MKSIAERIAQKSEGRKILVKEPYAVLDEWKAML